MKPRPDEAIEPLALPDTGAVRVHPQPQGLPRLRREGPGRNRFDDPDGVFAVRYAADTIHGCMIETMSRFRPHPDTEALLRDITGVDEEDPGEPSYHEPTAGLADWLAAQQVGHVQITSPRPLLVDIETPAVLDHIDKNPRVRAALDASGLGTPLDPARLDAGIIRLGGPIGRPITQAASRAVYEWVPGADGIGYWSRLDSAERCWAIYDHVPVAVTVTALDPAVEEHRHAVQAVAARFEINLPATWALP
jgi:RES domain